ncbi:hypothetical protein Zmor_006816 [Zophobas morio]|uniref:Uncharacterized protein n=1 Tax=Zophobas morio TaxID=2755281 RepID=A0AA38MNX2_9CUCU|nr:hypothetical protein Zmor_006816 [Zophobas morio]
MIKLVQQPIFYIGFCYKQDDPRRELMEVPDIVLKRHTFLQELEKFQNLEEPSLIILNKAPYQSTMINKAPTFASILKPQLLQLIERYLT